MRRRRLVLLVTVPVLAAAFAGCSGGPDDGIASAGGGAGPASTSSGPAPAANPAERRRQYVECLRQHGVDVADPEQGKGVELTKPDDPDAKEAASACRQYAPDVGRANGGDDIARQREYAACMRDNGVSDFPDPDPTDGLLIPKSIVHSPAFEEANRVCGAHFDKPGSK